MFVLIRVKGVEVADLPSCVNRRQEVVLIKSRPVARQAARIERREQRHWLGAERQVQSDSLLGSSEESDGSVRADTWSPAS